MKNNPILKIFIDFFQAIANSFPFNLPKLRQERDNILQDNQQLIQERQNLQAQLRDLIKEKKTVDSQIQDLIQELKHLETENKEQKSKNQGNAQQLKEQEITLQKIQEQFSQSQENLNRLEQESTELTGEIHGLQSTIEQLKIQNQKLEEKRNAYTRELEQLSLEKEKIKEEGQELESKNQMLAVEIERQKEEEIKLLEKLNQGRLQLALLQENCGLAQQDLVTIKQHYETIQGEKQELIQELEARSQERDQLIKDLDDLKNTQDQRKQWLKNQQEEIEHHHQQLEELQDQKQKLNQDLENIQKNLANARTTLTAITEDQEEIHRSKLLLEEQLEQLQNQKKVQHQDNKNLLLEFQQYKQQITIAEKERSQLEADITEKRQYQAQIHDELQAITKEKQDLFEEKEILQNTKNVLELEIKNLEIEKERLDKLSIEKQIITSSIEHQRKELYDVKDQVREKNIYLVALKQETEQQETLLIDLRCQATEQREILTNLQQQIEAISAEDDDLQEEPLALEIILSEEEENNNESQGVESLFDLMEEEDDEQEEVTEVEGVAHELEKEIEEKHISSNFILEHIDIDLIQQRKFYIKKLWEDYLEPNWYVHPRGYRIRFLGEIAVSRDVTESILDFLQRHLQGFQSINYEALDNYFKGWNNNHTWKKVFLFALSEYAYYHTKGGFYESICKRLGIEYSQIVRNTFNKIIEEGIEELSLPSSVDGYIYVSNLRLQNGIPQKYLSDFIDLFTDFFNEYGHNLESYSTQEVSNLLFHRCQSQHPERRKLVRFLKICSEGDIEPLPGKILKSIAFVAQDLEVGNLKLTDLVDSTEQKQIWERLKSFKLYTPLLIKYWDELIQIFGNTPTAITSQPSSSTSNKNNQLKLYLNRDDEIEIILPEQKLWDSAWEPCRGQKIQIKESNWTGFIPQEGKIFIPEQILEVNASEDILSQYCWYLISESNEVLYRWDGENVDTDYPLLIFDNETGDRLSPQELEAEQEIIIFYDQQIKLKASAAIEVFEDNISCSLEDWTGQAWYLNAPEGSFRYDFQGRSRELTWGQKATTAQEIQLRGLRLPGKQLYFLEPPSLWHPPTTAAQTYRLILKNPRGQQSEKTIKLNPSDRWQDMAIAPEEFKELGLYSLDLGKPYQGSVFARDFSLRGIKLEQNTSTPQENFYFCNQKLETFPLRMDESSQFWTGQIKIDDLHPIETIYFQLETESNSYTFRKQANCSGEINFDLAHLRDRLPEFQTYTLSLQILGKDFIQLLTLNNVNYLPHQEKSEKTWSKPVIKRYLLNFKYLKSSYSRPSSPSRRIVENAIKKIKEKLNGGDARVEQDPNLKGLYSSSGSVTSYILYVEKSQAKRISRMINEEIQSLQIMVTLEPCGDS